MCPGHEAASLSPLCMSTKGTWKPPGPQAHPWGRAELPTLERGGGARKAERCLVGGSGRALGGKKAAPAAGSEALFPLPCPSSATGRA